MSQRLGRRELLDPPPYHPLAGAWDTCFLCSAHRMTTLEAMLSTINPPTKGKTVPL
jgi:hypothetical protein